MAKFIAVKNFKEGQINAWKYFKIGEGYDGDNSDKLQADGFIKDIESYASDKAKEVEKEMAPLKAKMEAIQAKALSHKEKVAASNQILKSKKGNKNAEAES